MAAWKNRLARRLIGLFVLVVAVPVLGTSLILGKAARDQIKWTARALGRINGESVQRTGETFQFLGDNAIHNSTAQTMQIAVRGIDRVSQHMVSAQDRSLSDTARSFAGITRQSFDDATRHSITTNHAALDSVRTSVQRMIGRAEVNTEKHAGRKIESAMLALSQSLMEERATRLATLVDQSVSGALNILRTTAQMPDMATGDPDDQRGVLDALVHRFPMFLRVAALDHMGRETAMSTADPSGSPLDLRAHPSAPYFFVALDGRDYLGRDESEAPGAAPVLRIGIPITRNRGEQTGVLTARLSLADLWSAIRAARVGAHGFAYVVDGQDRN